MPCSGGFFILTDPQIVQLISITLRILEVKNQKDL